MNSIKKIFFFCGALTSAASCLCSTSLKTERKMTSQDTLSKAKKAHKYQQLKSNRNELKNEYRKLEYLILYADIEVSDEASRALNIRQRIKSITSKKLKTPSEWIALSQKQSNRLSKVTAQSKPKAWLNKYTLTPYGWMKWLAWCPSAKKMRKALR